MFCKCLPTCTYPFVVLLLLVWYWYALSSWMICGKGCGACCQILLVMVILWNLGWIQDSNIICATVVFWARRKRTYFGIVLYSCSNLRLGWFLFGGYVFLEQEIYDAALSNRMMRALLLVCILCWLVINLCGSTDYTLLLMDVVVVSSVITLSLSCYVAGVANTLCSWALFWNSD